MGGNHQKLRENNAANTDRAYLTTCEMYMPLEKPDSKVEPR